MFLQIITRSVSKTSHLSKLLHTFNRSYTTSATTSSLLFRGFPTPMDPDYTLDIYLLQHENDDNFHNGVFVNVPTPCNGYRDFEVVGSCNGLVCLCEDAYYDPVCVGNPFTREYVWLPRTGKRTEFDIVSGIGFDQFTNHFKVIRMMYDFVDNTFIGPKKDFCVPFRLEAKIHTLGIDKEWRRLGNLPYPLYRTEQPPVFANGALHWIIDPEIAKPSTNVYDRIVAFDVSKEEFQLIPTPPGFNPCPWSLVDLGGYLSIYVVFPDRYEIWVMKECGHKGSWSKEYIIPRQVEGFGQVGFRPITLMRNGDILLRVNGRALVCYDPVRKSFRKLEIHNIPPDDETVVTHVRSSISLKNIVGSTNRFFICSKQV